MIDRILKQALASLNYLLTIAVSVIVIIIAFVVFRSIVEEGDPVATTTTTTPESASAPTTTPLLVALGVTIESAESRCDSVPRTDADQTRVVRLYYACGPAEANGDTWVQRELDSDGGILTATMDAFVAGPDALERADGFRSLFSAGTADAILSVTRLDGSVVVNLRDLGPLPSLTDPATAATFVADLNNTMFQHDDVLLIEYRVEGSCDRFWAYFNDTECHLIERTIWEQDSASG